MRQKAFVHTVIFVLLLLWALPSVGFQAQVPANFTELRSAICDSTPTKDGCAKCPAYMGETVPGQALKFDGYIAGSFTAAGADEVLLRSPMSCYSHAAGFSSAVLLRKISGKW